MPNILVSAIFLLFIMLYSHNPRYASLMCLIVSVLTCFASGPLHLDPYESLGELFRLFGILLAFAGFSEVFDRVQQWRDRRYE